MKIDKVKNMMCFRIVYQNLKKRSLRTSLMIFFVFILSFTVYSSSMILESLELGITSTVDRMGADIILVPEGYVSNLQNALFMGEPCTIYFEKDWINKIQVVEGVKQVSSQLYLATLSDSDCCDSAVQIIAFDPETDFVIQPWIIDKIGGSLPDNQIVVGSNMSYEPGDTATYYGTDFLVAAKLDKTGMGYDSSVFLNYNTAYKLVQRPIISNYFSIGKKENIISMITIAVREEYNVDIVAKSIANTYQKDGISIFTSNSLVKGISNELKKFTSYSNILTGLLLILTISTLFSIFTITINERKREFGILATIGATRSQLLRIIVGESEIICLVGSLLGSFIAGIIILAFQNFIIVSLKLPFLQPSLLGIVFITSKCMIVSLLTGLIVSIYAAIKISSAEVYLLIRESE